MGEIIVEWAEYEKATAPDELYSGGLGPCIAIGAIYGKQGYLIHHHPVGHDYAAFIEPFFADLRRDVKDKNKLQIYAVGGAIEIDDEYKDEMQAGRQTVLDKIVQSGFEKCIKKVRWCPTGYIHTLRLILSEGRAEIEEDSIDSIQ